MKPKRWQFTLGGLMIVVAVAGVVFWSWTLVAGDPNLQWAYLLVVASAFGCACFVLGMAGLGIMFGRLTRPTVHPLSDHVVGYFGPNPAGDAPDPLIVFEPDDPPR